MVKYASFTAEDLTWPGVIYHLPNHVLESNKKEMLIDSEVELDDDDLFADKYMLSKGGFVDMEVGEDGESYDDDLFAEETGADMELDEDDLFADSYILSPGGSLDTDTTARTDEIEASSTVEENPSAALPGKKTCTQCRRSRPLEEFFRANRSRQSNRHRGTELRGFVMCVGCREYNHKLVNHVKTPGVCLYCHDPISISGSRITCKPCGSLLWTAKKQRDLERAPPRDRRCVIPQCDRQVFHMGDSCSDHNGKTPKGREGRAAIGICRRCVTPSVHGYVYCDTHLARYKLSYQSRKKVQRGTEGGN